MNYTIEDAIRTISMSSLDFLVVPNNTLIYKVTKKDVVLKVCG